MYTHIYMHDLRAQDLSFLNGTNSFKGCLHHAMALAMPEGSDYTGIPHICPRYMGMDNKRADRGEGSVLQVPPCLLGAM